MLGFSRNCDCVSPESASETSRPRAAPRWRSSSSARSSHHARGGAALGRCSSAAAARALGVVRRGRRRALSVYGCRRSRVLSGGGRRRAALAAPLHAVPHWRSSSPTRSCRRARGGVTLGRRSFATAARALGVVRRSRQRALSARGCRRGRILSRSGRRRAALAEPLPGTSC